MDYLYIGDFINNLQQKKGLDHTIPVSCFTATAKQKVIEDIRLYFKEKLQLDLKIFRADASRTNLHYRVYSDTFNFWGVSPVWGGRLKCSTDAACSFSANNKLAASKAPYRGRAIRYIFCSFLTKGCRCYPSSERGTLAFSI